MNLSDLLDTTLLEIHIADKLISRRFHPEYPELSILNYTPKCQRKKKWDQITLQCRGLIYNTRTNQVIARPLPKFFSPHEALAPTISNDDMIEVTDKLDGQLGIIYPLPRSPESQQEAPVTLQTYAVSTRGDFSSTGSQVATAALGAMQPLYLPADITYLVEIISPETKIIIDYGNVTELRLIACVDIHTGKIYGPSEQVGTPGLFWPGPRTTIFGEIRRHDDAMTMLNRHGAEGLVVRTLQGSRMLKLKQKDYLTAASLTQYLSNRRLLNIVKQDEVSLIRELLPPSLHADFDYRVTDLRARFDTIRRRVETSYAEFTTPPVADKKDFALRVRHSPDQSLLFARHSGGLDDAIWKIIERKFRSEDQT